jgi:hypothetical protein
VLLELLAEHSDTAEDLIPVAIETPRGLLTACLRAAGRAACLASPMAVARYRDRHSIAGRKSDHGDAVVLANILRTDLASHRPLPADTELARAIAVLARAQQDAVWDRTIALGGGLCVLAVRLVKRDAPPRTSTVVAAAGSFAAVSTLLGSPLLGAFLLMEASGLGGALLELVLVPGLLAAGIGSLIFLGLDHLTGLGTFSLAIPGLPHVGPPTGAEFLWALAIGVMAALAGSGIRWLGLFLRPHVERRMLLATPAAGLAVAGLAIAFAAGTGKGSSEVLFSGQSALGPFITNSAGYTVGALLLLLVCKGIAYGVSLSGFRGGPTFPALFLGAAGGVALSHLPGLPLVYGVAMGIGALCAVMLRLPLTSVLLATLLLSPDGLQVMPLAIVAVVVAYVASARLTPSPAPAPPRSAEAAAAPACPV